LGGLGEGRTKGDVPPWVDRVDNRERRRPGFKSTFFGMPKKVHKGTFFVLTHKEPALRKGDISPWLHKTLLKTQGVWAVTD